MCRRSWFSSGPNGSSHDGRYETCVRMRLSWRGKIWFCRAAVMEMMMARRRIGQERLTTMNIKLHAVAAMAVGMWATPSVVQAQHHVHSFVAERAGDAVAPDLHRCTVVQRLMRAPIVVKADPFGDPRLGLVPIGIALQIDVLVLHLLHVPGAGVAQGTAGSTCWAQHVLPEWQHIVDDLAYLSTVEVDQDGRRALLRTAPRTSIDPICRALELSLPPIFQEMPSSETRPDAR